MEHLVQLMCGAGRERAIALLGAPSPACARCSGFLVALAIGLALHRVASRRATSLLPAVALALALVVTSLQVACESVGAFVSTPELRFVLGGAVGLPLGWIAVARVGAAAGRALAGTAIVSTAITAVAFALVDPRLLVVAIDLDVCLAFAVLALSIARVARSPFGPAAPHPENAP